MTDANRNVLVVDDNRSIHEDFRAILTARETPAQQLLDAEQVLFGTAELQPKPYLGFQIDSAFQGQEAVLKAAEAAHNGRPYAVAFVDMRMPPGWDGLETVQHLWEADERVQVVLCTAYSDRSMHEFVERFGETDRLLIIKKPFDPDEIRLACIALSKKWHLARQAEVRENELAAQVAQRTATITAARDATVFALAKLAETRDSETGDHIARMREYAQLLAKTMGQTSKYRAIITPRFLRDFYRATVLHDIGKVATPDAILLKPGKLTSEEFEVMKRHTLIGAETLDGAATLDGDSGFLRMAASIARSHHERFDGAGYPDGLSGDNIPLPARIVSVADVFDALTSRRVYKGAMSAEDARRQVAAGVGTQFDPDVIRAFERCFDEMVAIKGRIEGLEADDPAIDCGLVDEVGADLQLMPL
ncbi:MAG TPA: HD domain-containing phosphohydrolase [Lacipirellula sp.]